MAESTQPKTRFLGTITITPGSGAAYTVAVEEGDLTINGLTPGQIEAILVEDRGAFATLVRGKQKYPTVAFSAYLRDLVDATDTTLVGVSLQRGAYASAQSTLGANRPYTVDILWTIDGTSQGDAANHTLLLEDVRVDDASISEADLNKISLSGTCYGTVTMT